MKIVFISDTHGQHHDLKLPIGDVLIHAGDVSQRGLPTQMQDFLDWFKVQPHPHKIFVAGNHDFMAERKEKVFQTMIPENCIYLKNSEVVIDGIKIWGSPITPWFYDWAFNRHRGAPIAKYWAQIPTDTDILITHGPPNGILDKTTTGLNVGCEELKKRIDQLNIKIHVFGHIHEAYGETRVDKTTFLNASVLNLDYRLVNAPIVQTL
jgi:Icc-related predicted phosphoesterase